MSFEDPNTTMGVWKPGASVWRMRVATSRVGALVARGLRRATGGRRPKLEWGLDHGPVFANCVGILTFDGEAATVCLERATADDDGTERLDVVFDVDLGSC